MSGLGRLRIERSGDDVDFVDDLAEGGKLVAFESLVENLLACARVEYPVVIVVIVVVDVVIPQYRMPSWNPCGIPVRYPTHFERRAHVPGLELLIHFQDNPAQAVHATAQEDAAGGRVMDELECMGLGMVYELVTSEALLMDGLVPIPRLPIVGVSSLRDRRSFRDRRM